MSFKTLDEADVRGKRVLVRADLNVPMRDGHISDMTRVERVVPTIQELTDKGARVVILSHFERPKGRRVPELSLAPLAEAISEVLRKPVSFADDCIGPTAAAAVAALHDGDVLLLENTRFHKGEEENDPEFVAALAKLGDIYVNDAFSAAHRAHASTEGVAHHMPAYAGRLMQAELEALESALAKPERPVMAIVGGSKVSTKLDLLGNMLVWNGPLGAFETPPFDASTMLVAKAVADLTAEGRLRSVAGGGDTVSALRQAGVVDELTYVSSAGGAFLEWLEGKSLPGVKALG